MKKITLDLNTLLVDSFEVATPEAARGTVQGHALATGTKPTCISCPVATDPCLCDPIRTPFPC
jgi:hypothetical protein